MTEKFYTIAKLHKTGPPARSVLLKLPDISNRIITALILMARNGSS